MAAKKTTAGAESGEKEEYLLVLAAFRRLVSDAESKAEAWEIFQEIIALRVASLFGRVLEGLKMDFDTALALLRRHNEFATLKEREERDILAAAIENLVDFAAAGEYAMMREVREEAEEGNHEGICRKYNLSYAGIENSQVLSAAAIAGWWVNQPAGTLLTYMTQGDERVRDTHLALEGLSFPKKDFPPDLIPPIEWGCRCYLISDSYGFPVFAALEPEHRKTVNPVFSESLATGGRIFSPAHPYFTLDFKNNKRIQKIIREIKDKLLCLK